MLVEYRARKLAETALLKGQRSLWCLIKGPTGKFFIQLCRALHNCEEVPAVMMSECHLETAFDDNKIAGHKEKQSILKLYGL